MPLINPNIEHFARCRVSIKISIWWLMIVRGGDALLNFPQRCDKISTPGCRWFQTFTYWHMCGMTFSNKLKGNDALSYPVQKHVAVPAYCGSRQKTKSAQHGLHDRNLIRYGFCIWEQTLICHVLQFFIHNFYSNSCAGSQTNNT